MLSKCVAKRMYAFSLVELLSVVAVITIMLSLVVPMMTGASRGRSVGSSVNVASGLTNSARTIAVLSKTGARVVVDMDPSSPGYLRRWTVVKGSRDASGQLLWTVTNAPQWLSEGTFFSPEHSSAYQTMQLDFRSGEAQTGSGAGTLVGFYEYDGSGRFVAPPGGGFARVVLVSGMLENPESASSALVVPESRRQMASGFILRRAGNVTYFQSADEIFSL